MVQNRALLHNGKGHFVTDEVSMHTPDAVHFDIDIRYVPRSKSTHMLKVTK